MKRFKWRRRHERLADRIVEAEMSLLELEFLRQAVLELYEASVQDAFFERLLFENTMAMMRLRCIITIAEIELGLSRSLESHKLLEEKLCEPPPPRP